MLPNILTCLPTLITGVKLLTNLKKVGMKKNCPLKQNMFHKFPTLVIVSKYTNWHGYIREQLQKHYTHKKKKKNLSNLQRVPRLGATLNAELHVTW